MTVNDERGVPMGDQVGGFPWFRVEAALELGRQEVATATAEVVGALYLLRCYAWLDRDGGVTADEARLAELTRTRGRWPQVRDQILGCLERHPEVEGKLVEPGFFEQWLAARATRERLAEAGRRSGDVRRSERGRRGPPPVSKTSMGAPVEPVREVILERLVEEPPEGVDGEDWRRACQVADLVESDQQGLEPVRDVRGQKRALSFVYLAEVLDRESVCKGRPWDLIEPTMMVLMEEHGRRGLTRLVNDLRRYSDGAYPGIGAASGTGADACRVMQAFKALSKAGLPVLRRDRRVGVG